MNTEYVETCPKCDSWNTRLVSSQRAMVENELTGMPEDRMVLLYECRDCPTEWRDYE